MYNIKYKVISVNYFLEPKTPTINIPVGNPTSVCGSSPFPASQLKETTSKRKKRVLNGFKPPPYALPWNGIVIRAYSKILPCSINLISQSSADKQTNWGLTAAHCFYQLSFNSPQKIRIP